MSGLLHTDTRHETPLALLVSLQPRLIFHHLNSFLPVCLHLFLSFCLSDYSSLSLCAKLRDEVTKLKFEAKTFHIYANQKEVCVCIMKTLPSVDGGPQEVECGLVLFVETK